MFKKQLSVVQIFSQILLLLLLFSSAFGATIKGEIPTRDLIFLSIKKNAKLEDVSTLYRAGKEDEAMNALLDSLKDRATERYYFDWRNFRILLDDYDHTYPGVFEGHRLSASYHISRYAPETHWDLPSVNLLGNNVTAYELRHLARQQKSFDMSLLYHKDGKKIYLDYWVRQVQDLMDAYETGEYEDAGNGIFEYYRAGRRIHSWMFNHHAYYFSNEYDKESQEILLKTFIYHAFDLAARTEKYHSGNHHTKGLVALFEMAMFLQDFDFSETFSKQAITLLSQHMEREINDDGFQFERSVHYHVGDIENYLRVYQLAKINHITLPELFIDRFEGLFNVMMKLAQPDLNLPVLQDDTDHYLQEFNELRGVFKTGALLFKDPCMNYLAGDKIPAGWFWLLGRNIEVGELEIEKPDFGSLAFKNTGYYIMREGWDKNDSYMSISAGVDAIKPDHQHGDILGLTAYANGYQILPTYQVKYNRPDYELFKNSWVKNVAIVDSIPHGLQYKGNRGGSGFGKFKDLPTPQTILWDSSEFLDIYIGSHDRYENIGVETYRTIVFLKTLGEWIVVDHFISQEDHDYQQIWQGLESSDENATLFRQFDDKLSMEIVQHSHAEYTIAMKNYRDKRSWMVSSRAHEFQFVTHIKLLDKQIKPKWFRARTGLKWNKNSIISIENGQLVDLDKTTTLVFGTHTLNIGELKLSTDKKMDLYLEKGRKGKYTITNISPYTLNVNGVLFKPGQRLK